MAQTGFPFLVEQCTASHESLVAVVEQHLFLWCQPAVMQVHLANALKQLWVQPHVVGVFGQYRLHLLCQRVHVVVGLSRQQVEEYRRNPVQQVVVAIALVEGVQNGIVESRFLRIIDGLFQVLIVAADTLHERLLVVFQSDAVKGHRVVQCTVRF